jgi:hypothetical protein
MMAKKEMWKIKRFSLDPDKEHLIKMEIVCVIPGTPSLDTQPWKVRWKLVIGELQVPNLAVQLHLHKLR